MSKKKEINLKSTPAAVESGDVNITYNNVLVGSLSDSGTAVLKTEKTICEHDIELEYTKPAGGISLPEVIVSSPHDIEISRGQNGTMLYEDEGNIVSATDGVFTKQYLVPTYIGREQVYNADIVIESANGDIINVTINNTSVPFDTDGYYYSYSSATYPEGFTVVITDKE